jgi:hypothetical protein
LDIRDHQTIGLIGNGRIETANRSGWRYFAADELGVRLSSKRFGPMMKKVLKIWPDISSGRVSQQRMVYIPKDTLDGIAKVI